MNSIAQAQSPPQTSNSEYSEKSFLVDMWAIQDSLLQNYRALLSTIQSIFVAVVMVVPNSTEWKYYEITGVLFIAIFTNCLWINLTRHRGLSVLFLQTLLRRLEISDQGKCTAPALPEHLTQSDYFGRLRAFQDDSAYRDREVASPDFVKPDLVRNILNFHLPIMFLVFWLMAAFRIDYSSKGGGRLVSTTSGLLVNTAAVFPTILAALILICVFSHRVQKNYAAQIPFWEMTAYAFILSAPVSYTLTFTSSF